MNTRERVLLFTLLGLLITVGAYGMFYVLYQKPMEALDRRLADADADIKTKNLELDAGLDERKQIFAHNPHLKMWQKVSLPDMVLPAGKTTRTADAALKHVNQVQLDYQRYLTDLMRVSGFNPATINVAPRPLDNKSSPSIPGKGPVYTKLDFTVTASASLGAVVKMMEQFHQDPLLQEVHTLTLDKPQTARKDNGGKPDDLQVTMTIEALMVTNAEKRTDLKPKFEKKEQLAEASDLHGGERNYEDIVIKKNIFNGYRPGGIVGAGPTLTEDRKEVLHEVKLTTVNRTRTGRWEATLYHQGQGERNQETGLLVEHMVNLVTKPKFEIHDRYENKVLSAEVKLIDDHMIVFVTEGKYYRMATGDFLIDAMQKPLTDAQLKELGLEPPAAKAEPEKKPETEKKADGDKAGSESAKKPEKKAEGEEPDQ